MGVEIDKTQDWLYRYRDFSEKNINALENNRLYFSIPEYFNDPYDNLIYADAEQIIKNVATNIGIGMKDYLERLNKKNPILAGPATAVWYGNKREEFLEGFLEDIVKSVEAIKEKVRKNVKIICFSKIYDSMLMWSHYADNHKGFMLAYAQEDIVNALRYDKTETKIERKTQLEPVEYVEDKVDLTEEIENYARSRRPNLGDVILPDGNIPQPKLRKMITQKAVDWSYEHEWRLIPRTIDLEKESPLCYIECVPIAVVLGAKCEEKNKEKILKIAHNKKIPVLEMVLSESSPKFKLEVEEIYNGFSRR